MPLYAGPWAVSTKLLGVPVWSLESGGGVWGQILILCTLHKIKI